MTLTYTPGDPAEAELRAMEECVNIVARAKWLAEDREKACDREFDLMDRDPWHSPAARRVLRPFSEAANEANDELFLAIREQSDQFFYWLELYGLEEHPYAMHLAARMNGYMGLLPPAPPPVTVGAKVLRLDDYR
ncbi:MAG TPA: hypothetical protein VHP58_04245 [Alphaproteobacteria bacterium]|nr:hypothetical protein [Alphaproteobacteria bacterium]